MRFARLGLAIILSVGAAQAGKVVIVDDNGMFGSGGYGDSIRYADNVATFFRGSSGGSFLAYVGYPSAIPLFSEASGNTITVDSLQPNLTRLGSFDGVFLGYAGVYDTGFQSDLVTYVNAGGNVHIVGGDYTTSPWQDFLHTFGLEFGGLDGLNGGIVVTAVEPNHPIMDGVALIAFDNGNQTLVYGSGTNSRVVALAGGSPVIAVYDSSAPEPTPAWLFGAGTVMLLFRLRRGPSARGTSKLTGCS